MTKRLSKRSIAVRRLRKNASISCDFSVEIIAGVC
jgi:hypothetical protein